MSNVFWERNNEAQRYITTERLDIYKKNLKVKPSQVMAAYHWNKALAGALLPAMQ
jgi:hypothetical protein